MAHATLTPILFTCSVQVKLKKKLRKFHKVYMSLRYVIVIVHIL